MASAHPDHARSSDNWAHDGDSSSYPKIQDYALIGDCRSVALISRRGSIEWLCWPRFDSPSIFAAILDRDRGGHCSICPSDPQASVFRRYVGDSNVLQTVWTCRGGTLVITDLMPVASEEAKHNTLLPDHELVRQAECTQGEVEVELDFCPRPFYGRDSSQLCDSGKLGVRMEVGRGVYWLRSQLPLQLSERRARARQTLREGEKVQFSLSYGEQAPLVLSPLGHWMSERVIESVLWWQRWAQCAKYDGDNHEAVLRSALTLKLMSYAPSGAIIAAPTTSLPERTGGDLNWDYRFCWLRDASLTVRALLGLGYWEEADDFINWLLLATRLTQPELRILYTVFGENAPHECQLDHVEGYRSSRPVRVGNAARNQLQLDVYGEVLDAVAQYAFHGGRFDRMTQKAIIGIGKYIAQNWDRPDQGIWEPRKGPQDHTHSRVLCWTALDRLINLADDGDIENAPAELFRDQRERILNQVRERAWNAQLRSYASTLGGNDLDASLLLLAYYGFEAPDCERMRATYDCMLKNLRAPNELLYRYRIEPTEGAFGICSFWEAEYLALGGGTLEEAKQLFQHLLTFQNDLGLYAEEIDPQSGDALGNFPQAFTHVGLISAALAIHERERGKPQLAHRGAGAEEKRPQEVAR